MDSTSDFTTESPEYLRESAPNCPKERRDNSTLTPDLINDLVEESGRILDEMLKELNCLIKSEIDPTRKESLAKMRINALKERTNFRLLSRHLAKAAASTASSQIVPSNPCMNRNGLDSEPTGDFIKDFDNLPEKLVEKFARDLPVSKTTKKGGVVHN